MTAINPEDRRTMNARSSAQLESERAMQNLETYLHSPQASDIQVLSAERILDGDKKFKLTVDVAGERRPVSVTLTVGGFNGEFYVEVYRQVGRTTTCSTLKEILFEVRNHAEVWA